MRSPVEFDRPARQAKQAKSSELAFIMTPVKVLFRGYQIILSPINRQVCQTYPSCSHYGLDAVRRYHMKGVFMTTDRLLRCGHEQKYDKRVRVGRQILLFDPVPERKK